LIILLIVTPISAQTIWTIDDCIKYALEKNIQIQQAYVSSRISEINLKLARAAYLPSLIANIRQNFSWNNQVNTTTGATVLEGRNGTNFSLSSDLPVFDGFRIKNSVRRSEADFEASQYNIDVIKESISLNVLNAYLQVLFAEEQVTNDTNQIASTREQLNLAAAYYTDFLRL
jgi:outer membrane protein